MRNLLPSHPAIDTTVLWFRARLDKARSESPDGGYTAVEWIIITAIVIAIVVAASVIISAAVSQKATDVGNCITGANTTNNGGCK